jgi:zinc/manganese transport system permease protein
MSPLTASLPAASGFSWNIAADLRQMLAYEFMRNAFEAGAVVSVVAGVVGYFVILRRNAFAAHALSHIGFAGAAGAVMISVAPVWGLLAFCLGSGAAIGAIGQKLRARDTAIGIVLTFSLGLGSLFLALYNGQADEVTSILFGQISGVSPSQVLLTVVIGALAVGLIGAVYRPLLFASVDEDVARARGVPVRALSIGFVMILALVVAVSVQVVGVLLIFALTVTPAAAADVVSRSPRQAMAIGVAIALASTWLAIFISWYSGKWPASFFITSISTAIYVVLRVAKWLSERRLLRQSRLSA